MIYASDLLYVWALFCSKLAVCVLIKRLCISRYHMKLAKVLTGACMGFGVISMFVVGLRQRTREPWNGEPATGQSTVMYPRTLDALTC